MKYQVTVTHHWGTDPNNYGDETIFQQFFEELDLTALARYLNQRPLIIVRDGENEIEIRHPLNQ